MAARAGTARSGTARGGARSGGASRTSVAIPQLAWNEVRPAPVVLISGAEGVLVNITGGRDLTLHEVNEAAGVVVNAAGEDANVIFGAVIDPNMDGEIVITVVATGFGQTESHIRLVDKSRVAATVPAGAGEEYARPQAGWRREEPRQNRWSRREHNGDSLEVPTFLRKQMD